MRKLGKILLVAGIPALADLAVAQAADNSPTNKVPVLPEVTVRATNFPPSLTSPNLQTAKQQEEQTPGGLTIRDAWKMDRSRASSFLDLLEGIPGVTLQSENGVEVTKYSSRGSGILSDNEPIGVIFLLDGFPFNQGDGEVILEDFSLSSIKYAEVFRGANAFKYGAISLGGAVNLVSRTGYDADPFQFRFEGGSFGFMRLQASTGGVEGKVDYFASVTGRTTDGYRQHSYENSEDFFGNIGYKFNENVENRLYLSATRTDHLSPSGLTKDDMYHDPRQVDSEVTAQDLDKRWYYLRLADKVSFKNEVEQADFGGYWWHRNLSERNLFDANNFDGIQGYYSDNYGIILNSITHLDLFGKPNNFTIGFTPTLEVEQDADFPNNNDSEAV